MLARALDLEGGRFWEVFHIDWRREQVSAMTLGSERGGL